MLESRVKVINQLGLHARAAAQLIRVSNQFKSNIQLEKTGNSAVADAKSILGVLALAAARGTVLTLKIDGVDEIRARSEIEKLFEEGFGEL